MSIRQVVDTGLCIGCGACTSAVPRIRVDFNQKGDLVAHLPQDITPQELNAGTAVCPFTEGEDETTIAKRLYGPEQAQWHGEIGMHVGNHAAYSPRHQAQGSSGGVVTWILTRLLERGLIDHAIHVGRSESKDTARFFEYRVSSTSEQVEKGSTSFYYPVSMDEVLKIIKNKPGRYAITGVPCFHKALRKLRATDAVLDDRIKYQIGIVCGQMKSAHYLNYLTHMAKAPEGRLQNACFRRKMEGSPANDYAFEAVVESADGKQHMARVMNSTIGVNWGMGYFKPKACEFCDDVLAENADIAAMDAWLPQFTKDGRGWSLVTTRTQALEAELQQAKTDQTLVAEPVTAQQVADSQRGGLNHRRIALPYRLWMHRAQWTPKKRAPASAQLAWPLKLEQRLRELLRHRSREVWLRTGGQGQFAAFARQMKPYETLYRWVGRLKRWVL
jgi:coenzyme F420 hydrogenase subunit beta